MYLKQKQIKQDLINITVETDIEMTVKIDTIESTAKTDLTEMRLVKNTTNQEMIVMKDIIDIEDKTGLDIIETIVEIIEMTVKKDSTKEMTEITVLFVTMPSMTFQTVLN